MKISLEKISRKIYSVVKKTRPPEFYRGTGKSIIIR
jgi:hypothetical protein